MKKALELASTQEVDNKFDQLVRILRNSQALSLQEIQDAMVQNRMVADDIRAALASLGLHFWADGRYGIFRDELYYLDCSKHLAAGYVDHPALSIWLLAAWRAVFGESVGAIRVLPALAGAGLVVLTGLLARELGGRLPAQGLAAVAALAAPCYLGITGYYSMNAFDLLFWALAFFLVVRLLKTGRTTLWIPFGGVMGLGLENKIGLLKELWLGGGLALILFLPYLAWEATHQWATLEFMHNAATRKIAALGVVGFSVGQLLEMHPFNCILALVGLVFLLGGNEGRYRPLGLIWLFAFAIFALQRSKPYYLVGAYPPLLAAGACAVAGVHSRSWRRWLTASVLALLVIGGAVTAPFAIPLLPVDRFIAYQTALGVRQPSAENQEQGVLPQFYADRFGWEELAAGVAAAYTSLPPRMRSASIPAAAATEMRSTSMSGRTASRPRSCSRRSSRIRSPAGHAGSRPDPHSARGQRSGSGTRGSRPGTCASERLAPGCVRWSYRVGRYLLRS